jgi:hypothetical protein
MDWPSAMVFGIFNKNRYFRLFLRGFHALSPFRVPQTVPVWPEYRSLCKLSGYGWTTHKSYHVSYRGQLVHQTIAKAIPITIP